MKKILKRLTAIILCLLIITGTIISDNMQAKATGVPIAVSSALKAIVGTGISYAGYKATKKQLADITSTTSSLLKDYGIVARKTKKENVITKSVYTAWVSTGWVNHPYRNILISFAERCYDNVIDDIQNAWLNEHAEDEVDLDELKLAWLNEHYAELEGLIEDNPSNEEPTTEKPENNNNKMPKCTPWVIGGIGAQAGIQVALSLGFNKNMSQLVSDIIKQDYNSEYEKAKGKYDWEKLGFTTDYDTLEISKSSTEQFADYEKRNNKFNHNNTLIKTSLSGNIYSLLSVPCGVEKTALVTIRNPNTGLWKTVFLTEEQLYYFASSVKNGSYTFTDIDNIINSRYFYKDNTIPSFPLASFNIVTSNNALWSANDCFFESFAKGEYYSNPLTVTYRPSDNITVPTTNGETEPIYLQKSNTTIYNVGKTLNFYFWNFADESKYIGSTTALNGLEDIKPAVKNSIYTNTADEIDKHPNISIDTNKDYDNTDEQIEDIAQDNDLYLEVIEDNTEEITDNTKGIWETLKSIPRKIYNFFSGILEKILKAIKSNPLSIWNYFKNPMSQLINGINAILEQGGINVQIPDISSITSTLSTIAKHTTHSRNFIEDIDTLLRQFLLDFKNDYETFNVQDILNKT